MTRKNPWESTSYRQGDQVEVKERDGTWSAAYVQKAGGWRLIVAFPGGGAVAIDSPNNVRKREKP